MEQRRENSLLVQKVIEIHKRAEQAVLKTMSKQLLAKSMIDKSFSQEVFPHTKSLNIAVRNKERSRISKENLSICNRIDKAHTSGYSNCKKHLKQIFHLKSIL